MMDRPIEKLNSPTAGGRRGLSSGRAADDTGVPPLPTGGGYAATLLFSLSAIALWLPTAITFGSVTMPAWQVLFAMALACAVRSRQIRGMALLAILMLWALSAVPAALPTSDLATTGPISAQAIASVTPTIAGLLTYCLLNARLPTVRNPVVLACVRWSDQTPPYTLHARLERLAPGIVLVAGFCTPLGTETPIHPDHRGWTWVMATSAIAFITVVGVFAAAWRVGLVRPDPKLPPGTLLFLTSNLLFTCLVEEALFRGLLLHRLLEDSPPLRLDRLDWGAVALPLLLSSALFGLHHHRKGLAYVMVSGLAGLGYGCAYMVTGRLEAAIAVHLTVNTVHFLGFTYPRLA